MEININNQDVNLESIENNNLNDEIIQIEPNKSKEKKKEKKPRKITNEIKEEKESSEIIDSDDIIYKNNLIKKISLYKKEFSEFLTEIKHEQIEKKSIEELESILINVKDTVSNRNITQNINGIISLGPVAIENIGCSVGLELQGYSQLVNSNKEYYYTMKEIMIESNFMENINIDPKLRLMYILGTSAYFVHNLNSEKKKKLNSNLNSNINDNLKQKFSDI